MLVPQPMVGFKSNLCVWGFKACMHQKIFLHRGLIRIIKGVIQANQAKKRGSGVCHGRLSWALGQIVRW